MYIHYIGFGCSSLGGLLFVGEFFGECCGCNKVLSMKKEAFGMTCHVSSFMNEYLVKTKEVFPALCWFLKPCTNYCVGGWAHGFVLQQRLHFLVLSSISKYFERIFLLFFALNLFCLIVTFGGLVEKYSRFLVNY